VKRHVRAGLAALLLLIGAPVSAQPPSPRPAQTPLAVGAAAARDAALKDGTAMEIVTSLTREVGARPTGSVAAVRARDWGLAKFRALGFQNVRAEPFTVTAWRRGAESAEIISPTAQPLRIMAIARSISTPPGGLRAPVEVFDSYAALLAQRPASLAGKIVLVNQKMVRTQDGSGYGAINPARTQGAVEAARRGAIAYLVRSLSTDDGPAPHTGAMRYSTSVIEIPAASLSPPDADRIAELARRGQVVVRLNIAADTVGSVPAWNVVGEIPGTTDEVIVIGGHLDSWDVGTGAVDDAAGIAITTAAARLVGQQPGQRRRTLRVVMFGAEEIDESSAAYVAAHPAEVPRMVIASESDAGAGPVFAVRLPAGAAGKPEMAPLAGLLAPLKIFIAREAAVAAGADTAGLVAMGVPVFNMRQDMSKYFDWHHSVDDTLDKINPDELAQNVAAWATMLYLVADSAVEFRAPRQEARP